MPSKKPRIAVLSATPRFLNAGMLCVNLAAEELLKRLNLYEFAELYCFDMPVDFAAADALPDYRPIQEMDSYELYDLILIWGDFIVTEKWINEISGIVQCSSDYSFDQAKEMIEERVLLKNCSLDVYRKTIVFGQSLMIDDRSIFEADELYLVLLRKLITSAKFVRFRDAVSAYRAHLISGSSKHNYMGVDAALLLCSLGIPRDSDDEKNRCMNRIGIFFGRTLNARLTKSLLGLSLRKSFPDYQRCWIPWLKERADPGMLTRLAFGLSRRKRPDDAFEMLCDIRKCNFVIVDTYHIALIAWSLGVPAVCIGNGSQKFEQTVDDKKKEMFFSQNYLSDLYLFNEMGWKMFCNGKMKEALSRASDPDLGRDIKERLRTIAEDNIAALSMSIHEILRLSE